MNTNSIGLKERDVSPSAEASGFKNNPSMFQLLFERSADAILLLDPETGVFVDCNDAAVALMRASSKEQILCGRPDEMSPLFQPCGRPSREMSDEITALVAKNGGHRFEWVALRFDAQEVPMEVLCTQIEIDGRCLNVVVPRDISERKKIELDLLELNQSLERRVAERTAALTTSEARFRALVEHAPEAIVVFDGVTARILFGNEHACALYGVPMEKLAELTPESVSPEFQSNGRRSSELAQEKMAEALAGGMPVFEWIHRRSDGVLIPTQVRLLRLPAEGENLIRASIIDNTENIRAQRALRDSEEKFRALFEGSSQGVILHDENRFLEANPAAARIMGRQNSQELVGQFPTDTSPQLQPSGESSESLARKHIEECMANGSARFDWMSTTPRGGEIPLEVTLTRIQWSGRQVIQALISDISERKKAEQELRAGEARLRESEARFSAAFHASPIVTAIFRASDARIVLVNDALLNWAGCERDELIGRTTIELGFWEDLAEREQLWKEVLGSGTLRERECRLINRRGRVCTMLTSGVIIEINGADHLLVMMVDISQRKLAETELHRTLAREKELSQLKSNFVSMVSHEFRTPLGIIQSSAELLRDFHERMEPGERDEQLQSISRNTRRMAGMMEEILVLSRLDAGKLDFQPTALDLNGFCRRVVDEVQSATNRRCQIELNLGPGTTEVRADERLIAHIFTNLLNNAVKYSALGATVHFGVERDARDAVCTVRDEGIGISEEDQQHLFKAFHRGSNVGTRPGTGLGLLLVKRCAELHGGRLQLESKIGAGTTVTLRLPVFGGKHEKNTGH